MVDRPSNSQHNCIEEGGVSVLTCVGWSYLLLLLLFAAAVVVIVVVLLCPVVNCTAVHVVTEPL